MAIDSADVVLMHSSLTDAAAAVRLSRGTIRNIHENLFWAFFYNLICIPLAAGLFGWQMNPMIGAAAMSLSSFTVCMNALRLNRLKPQDASHDRPLRKRKGRRQEEGQVEEKIMQEKEGNAPAIRPEKGKNAGRAEEIRKGEESMEATVRIDGMMCGHCEANVKKAMEALPFVESAEVSHESGTAVLKLSGALDEQAVKEAVEAKDYTFVGIG